MGRKKQVDYKFHIGFSERHKTLLEQEANELNLNVTELIRRIIDKHIENKKDNN